MKSETIAFVHIPKCAGTTMVDVLNRLDLRWWHVPYGIYAPEYEAMVGTAETSIHGKQAAIASGDYEVIFGHFAVRDVIKGLGHDHPLRFAVMLRDPVERLVSDYYYSISAASGAPEWTLRLFPTIRDFILRNTETEILCTYLEEYRGEAPEAIAARIVNDFAFVGLTDHFDEAASAFACLFGATISEPVERRNITRDKPITIDPELVAIARARNARDITLYDLVRAGLAERGVTWLLNPAGGR